MNIVFNPENPILRECSFFVIAEITHGNDPRPIRVSTAAPSHTALIDAIDRALFATRDRDEGELTVLRYLSTSLEANERWNINTILKQPIDAHVGFDDGASKLVVSVFAIIDTATGPSAVEQTKQTTGADHLFLQTVNNAVNAGNISFIGHASPETFKQVTALAMHDAQASVIRLCPPGVKEGDLPLMENGSSKVTTIELIYPDDSPLDAIIAIWKPHAEITPAFGGITIKITAEITKIFHLIEQARASYVGFKITKE